MNDKNRITIIVGDDEGGVRLDSYLASKTVNISRSRIQKYNKEGFIDVDGISRPDHYSLKPGEKIVLTISAEETEDFKLLPQSIPLKITYEDEDIVVINKHAGLVVHPAYGNWNGTLINALLGRGTALSGLGGPFRPGIVHRLDKDTSGLIVVAKSDRAYEGLASQVKQRRLKKVYHAISWGSIGEDFFTVEAPIGRHPVYRQKMTVMEKGGREAASNFFIIDKFRHFDYIRITTSTGRTHQIRVHLSHIRHPILGDPVYGGRRGKGFGSNTRAKSMLNRIMKLMVRHALHASGLEFEHPGTGSRLAFKTALPDDMRRILEILYLEDRIKEARV